ncbi:high light inducible protein [Synechococcus sp. PROS-7-1]|uniref:chlorophyll a/b-binding protein n=1 Tax=Synechococcus sp. PROS-7-1 TaxID=1442556 RepID=UPI0016467371|nr:chlorophyll a/b-binding protein [Synechococcus sp. PROS-7-1]QNI86186.1 high light inducible protein [Synechococcus sp. PROS-7-1]
MTTSSADASVKGPESESTPTTSATTSDIPAFGWSAYAERVNGRFAMIGFVAVLAVEAISHDTFLHWAGFLR